MITKPTILIIGGSSFVARNFIRLQEENYTICVISRTKTGFDKETIISDFSSLSMELFKGVDVVINCAAIVHQQKKVEDKIYTKINFDLAVDLASKAKKAGVKTFIQLSTIAVYGKQTHITANTVEKPVNAYGKSKLEADNSLKKMTDNHFTVVVFRPPMIYGSTDAPGNMMRLIKLIAKGFPLPFKNITNKRDFIHIANLIGFMDAAIKKNISGVFLVSDNSPVFISELYTTIVSALEKSNKAFHLPAFCFKAIKKLVPGIYDKLFENLTIDSTYALETLSFKPKVMLEEGIQEMVAGIRITNK